MLGAGAAKRRDAASEARLFEVEPPCDRDDRLAASAGLGTAEDRTASMYDPL